MAIKIKTQIGYAFLIFTLSIVQNCSWLRVNKLTSKMIFSTPIDKSENNLNIPNQSGLYYEIPSTIGIVNDWYIVSEPSAKKIKIFKENKLSVIIKSDTIKNEKINAPADSSVKVITNHYLNIPGMITGGQDDDFYVVSFSPTDSESTYSTQNLNSTGIYKILHFDVKGNFLQFIGRHSQIEMPFEKIVWMDVDENNHLWVSHRSFGELYLDKYNNGQEMESVDEKLCTATLFPPEKIDPKHLYTCEILYPFYDGRTVLMVGRVDEVPEEKSKSGNYIFLYRKYITYDLKDKSSEEIFGKITDPESYPYIPYNDHILIWRTVSSNRVKLAVYNDSGNLINNLQIDFFGKRSNWRSTYVTLTGNTYSIRVFNNALELYQWN